MRQGRVGGGVLQCRRRRVLAVVVDRVAWGSSYTPGRDVAERGVVRVPVAAVDTRSGRRGADRVLAQGGVELLLVPVEQATRPQVDQERGHRVTGHRVGFGVVQRPAGQPAQLAVGGQQRQSVVAGHLGFEERDELVLRAVGVPQRERLVRRVSRARCAPVVEPAVASVDVAGDVRVQQRVVQRGVERHLPVGGAAVDLGLVQLGVPRVARRRPDAVEVEARGVRLGGEVVARARQAGVGQRQLDGHRPGRCVVSNRTQPPLAPPPLERAAAVGEGAAAPRPERRERAAEPGARSRPCGSGVEEQKPLAVTDPSTVSPPTMDTDETTALPLLPLHLGGVEQHVGLGAGREGVALPAGPQGGGQLGGDTVGHADPVVARRVPSRSRGSGSGRRCSGRWSSPRRPSASAGPRCLPRSPHRTGGCARSPRSSCGRSCTRSPSPVSGLTCTIPKGSAAPGKVLPSLLRADERVDQGGQVRRDRGRRGRRRQDERGHTRAYETRQYEVETPAQDHDSPQRAPV